MTGMTSSLPRKIRRFGRDRRGVSAVEFAFIAPVMIGLYLGCAEISDGVAADRKVSLIAGTLANLTAQATTLLPADMTNIFNASGAIMAPYNAANLTMTVTCLSIDANKNRNREMERRAKRHGKDWVVYRSTGARYTQHTVDL